MSANINEAIERACPEYVVTVLKGVDRDLTDESFPIVEGIIGHEAIENFTRTYSGTNTWVLKMKARLEQYGRLTLGQRRSVANIIRKSLRKEATTTLKGHPTSEPPRAYEPDPEAREYECFTCGMKIVGRSALYAHKRTHETPTRDRMAEARREERFRPETPVLPDYEPALKLDLTPLPDARFAVRTEDGSTVYLWKKTLKKRTTQYGKFVWTKHRYARENFYPGDVIARKIAGDTKELIGHQKKGKPFYSGEYEEAWQSVLEDPVSAMKLYGKLVKSCAYCGRTLTDPLSQDRGIGPDCWENKHIPAFGWGHPSYLESV